MVPGTFGTALDEVNGDSCGRVGTFLLYANFHEKAHFVKADVAAPSGSSATACVLRYASIRTFGEPTLR